MIFEALKSIWISIPTQKNIFISDDNKKVPMKLSDELNGKEKSEAVFLKPKAHSINFIERFHTMLKQSAKGVNRAVKSTLHRDNYKTFFFERNFIGQPLKVTKY